MKNKCDDCIYEYPHIECINCGSKFIHFIAKEKIKLHDISDLMQQCVAKFYTFMFSQSGLPNDYTIHIAYMNKNWENKSIRLSYNKEEGLIHQCTDENHSRKIFSSIGEVMKLLYDELGD